MIRIARAWAGPLLLLLSALGLGACTNLPGESGLGAELARVRGVKSLAIVSASPERAVFMARGQRILVEPPEGYCLDEDSVAVSRNAAFALVADCLEYPQAALAEGGGAASNGGAAALPRSFPGILTVSISGAPAYGTEPGSLDAFEELLVSDSGLDLLGRGTNRQAGRVVATRRVGGALYVLIHEPVDETTSILAPNFWRAFLEVRDRLVLVTVSSFVDRPMAEDAMMGFLAQQMVRLREGNGLGGDPEESSIAAAMAASLTVPEPESGPVTQERPEPVGVIAPGRAPRPRDRLANARTEAAPPAPHAAPRAPARPG